MGSGMTWYESAAYWVLWELAGMEPPNFHEDELDATRDALRGIASAISNAVWDSDDVMTGVRAANVGDSVDAAMDKWDNVAKPRLLDLVRTLDKVEIAIGTALVDIAEFKVKATEAVAAYDLSIPFTGGATFAVAQAKHAAAATARQLAHNLLDEIEGKLLAIVVEGTPLKALADGVAGQINQLLDDGVKLVATEGARAS